MDIRVVSLATKATLNPSKPLSKRSTFLARLSFALVLCGSLNSLVAAEKARPRKARSPAPAVEQPSAKPPSVEDLIARVRESVVVISSFGRDGREDGVGTGFVISADGLIATSLHVIGEARPISVRSPAGKRYDATEIHAWDRALDLAIIRIASTDLKPLALGNSDQLKQGASVIAIGNPLGLTHSVVQGIVSARREFDGQEMIQLAIPIEPGNSGGPMIDMDGNVQGILTLKSALSRNLGFAMPVNALKPLLAKPNKVPLERWVRLGSLDSKQWTPLFGARWRQKVGRIEVEGTGSGFGGRSLCLSEIPVPDRPFEVAVTVRLDDESGAAGLMFASDGESKHYGFYPTAGQVRLTRFEGPDVFSWTILKQVQTPHYKLGEWNRLKVRIDEDRIRCFVNGHLVFESSDEALSGGRAGIVKFRDTKAAFKEFAIGKSIPEHVDGFARSSTDDLKKQLIAWDGETTSELQRTFEESPDAARALIAERALELERDSRRLRDLAKQLHHSAVQRDLKRALEADEVDLVHASLLLAKFDDSELDIAAYHKHVDSMASALGGALPERASDRQKLDRLKEYMFGEQGFHGSRSDYYNSANSHLNQVIDDREGLPITLSVLFIELAHRIGLTNVWGVALPGHFVVKFGAGADEELIDVFEGGRVLSRAAAADIALNQSGSPLRDEDLRAASNRDIVLRMIRNLHNAAQRTEQPREAVRYLDLVLAIAPESAVDRIARARVREELGDRPGAREDLKWLIEKRPPGIDLDRVAEWYDSL